MVLDPSISAALATLHARRAEVVDPIDRAIAALLALDDGNGTAMVIATDMAASTYDESGASSQVVTPRAGGGAGGARKVLRDTPGRGFTASQLADAMVANGWITPSKNRRAAARAAANRLREDASEHVFFEDHQFVYRPPSDELEGLQASTQGDGGM